MLTKNSWAKLLKKAKTGDSEAQWEAGSHYHDGFSDLNGKTIVRKNSTKAVHWYRLSAEQGNSSAQIGLAICLSDGTGIEKNDAEALRWLKKALKQGVSIAAINIANIYRDQGKQQRAFFWYQRAVEMGDDDALVDVGERLFYGDGVRQDPKAAVKCFRKAIKAKFICQDSREEAMYFLGKAYMEGKGVRKLLSKAKELFELANIDDDYPAAREMLAKIADL